MQLLYTVLVGLFGYLGLVAKRLYEQYVTDKTKQDVCRICVQAIQQMYKDLDGPEKYQKCVKAVTDMLNAKGIVVTELELQMLIEDAVGEFKAVWYEETDAVTDVSSVMEARDGDAFA